MSEQIEEYLDFSAKIDNYLSAVMVANNFDYTSYNYTHIWSIIKAKGVSIRGFSFDGLAKHRISGMIVKDKLETTIVYNQHMNENRKNFTISHEIVHYLFHLNDLTTVFMDNQKSSHYSYSELLHEFQANIGASAILIPNIVLFRHLKEGYNLNQISMKFGISVSALYIRLIQTMQANFDASFITAKKNADAIRYHYLNKGEGIAVELGKNLEKRLYETNHFIEAL